MLPSQSESDVNQIRHFYWVNIQNLVTSTKKRYKLRPTLFVVPVVCGFCGDGVGVGGGFFVVVG